MPVHVPLLITAGIAAASLAAVAVIVVMDNPETREHVERFGRRFAQQFHPDGMDDEEKSALFGENSRQDSDGFSMSESKGHDDADEDTRRQQREEIMYWNAVRESQESLVQDEEKRAAASALEEPESSGMRQRFGGAAGAALGFSALEASRVEQPDQQPAPSNPANSVDSLSDIVASEIDGLSLADSDSDSNVEEPGTMTPRSEDDMSQFEEVEGVMTPSTWSEVGSHVGSDDDL